MHVEIHFHDGIISLGTPVSSTKKTDRHDITQILLKVAFSILTPTLHVDLESYN